jgi:hypothetical protein
MRSARVRAAAAYGGLAVAVGLAAAAVGFYVVTRSTHVDLAGVPRLVDLAIGSVGVVFAAVGAVIAVRRPGNLVGWLFTGVGVFLSLTSLAEQFAVYAIIGRSRPLAGGALAAWFQSWSSLSALTFGVALLLLLFPNGRLLTRRWRVVAWAVAIGSLSFCSGYLIDPGRLNSPFSSVDNPLGIAAAEGVARVLIPIGFFLALISIIAAAISQVLRYRRAGGLERQQIKWLGSAGALLATALLATLFFDGVSDAAEGVAFGLTIATLLAIPLAAGMAILRYRLYEIDVVINRTLVYGSVTALLAGTYVGLVLLFQLALRPVTGGSGLAVALSTLAVAALFRPARNRVQEFVDRRFYRHKYDAERTLQAFAARVRDEVDLEALRAELTAVVAQTMQPVRVSLWLRDGEAPVTQAVTIPRRLLGTKESA